VNRRVARVLVTGASGQIGQALTVYLSERGIEVTALSRRADGLSAVDRSVIGDATSVADVASALEGVDSVVHLAAIAHRDLGTPYAVYSTNVNSTFNVLSQAGQRGVDRAVIASSIHAYGVPLNPHDPPPAYFPLDEDIPADIGDWYSLSKCSDELTAQMAWRHWGIDVVALRFPLVKSTTALREEAAVVRANPVTMMRLGWAYLDLQDAVRAIHLSLTAELHGAHVLALSAADTLIDRPTSELVEEFAAGVPVRHVLSGHQALVDASRAARLIGFTPEVSIHQRSTDRPSPIGERPLQGGP